MVRGRPAQLTLAGLLVGCLLIEGCTHGRPTRRGDIGGATRTEAVNSRAVTTPVREARSAPVRGSERWRLSRPARRGQIEGYATTSSGLPGARVELRVSTAARSFRVRAYRIGAYAGGDGRLVWGSRWLPGLRQREPSFSDAEQRTVVARWRRSAVLDTAGWSPGLYVFKLRTRSGWQAHVPYVVSSPSSAGRVALVAPVTTWQAYNDWGGYSLYKAPSGDRRSWTVSLDRPYPAPGAGEMQFGAVPVVLAAERLGIPLAYFTNIDVDLRADALAGARGYVSMGHDEYWTPRMRDRVRAARDAGTNLAFLGANTMYWRIRLRGAGGRPGRLVTGYRSDAHLDPAPRRVRTSLWRASPDAEPENALTGMRYECFPVDAPWRVESPGWWGYAGTRTRAGEEHDHLVGIEADRVYPVKGTPRPLQVLAHVAYSCRGLATSAQAVYYTTESGAGVVNVGTLRWTCALVDRCPVELSRRTVGFVNRVTANVLRAFAAGPVGRRHPARDNVGRFHLPTQNLVPAS